MDAPERIYLSERDKDPFWWGYVTFPGEKRCDGDTEYVRHDLAAKLREQLDFLQGVCDNRMGGSLEAKKIDGLLDETKWLAPEANKGGIYAANESATI